MTSWINSIDVDSYVTQLMNKESDKITKVMNNKLSRVTTTQSGLNAKVSAYGQLQSLLDTFQQKITKLNDAFQASYQVSSSNVSVATVGADSTVTPGTHSLVVANLAQADAITSGVVSTRDQALGKTDTLTITVGSQTINLPVGATDSLEQIKENINTGALSQNAGISADIISTGTGQYRLVVSSTEAGEANKIAISETGTDGNALGITTGVGGTGTYLSTAKNAAFTFDGVSFSTSSNTTSILGMKIDLHSEGSATLTSASVNDTAKAKTAVQDMVNAYNETMTYIAKIQATVNAVDPTFAHIQEKLKNVMTGSLQSSSSALANIGIVPVSYKDIQSIPITLADGKTPGIAKPTGLIKIDVVPGSGESFDSMLANKFSTVKSSLLGDSSATTALTSLLAKSTGDIWKSINDPEFGALNQANSQLSKIKDTINSAKARADSQKADLVEKYAKLNMLLNTIKIKSQSVDMQIQSWNNKG